MPEDHRIGPIDQIPPGEGRNFEVAGQPIAVFHTRGGAIYATQAYCPHRAGPLADGMLGESVLVCPLHDMRFDLTTGEPMGGPCSIKVYPVRMTEDHDVLLTLDPG